MSEPEITIKARYRRVIQVKQYEPAEADFEISETFPGTMPPEEIVECASSQFQIIKSLVFQQLGLDFKQDEITGLIMEAFPGTEVVTSINRAKNQTESFNDGPIEWEPDEVSEIEYQNATRDPAPPAPRPRAANSARSGTSRPGGAQPGRPTARAQKGSTGAKSSNPKLETDILWRELIDHPERWFDNRFEKTNEKAPDFRHKTKKNEKNFPVSLWLTSAPDWAKDEWADDDEEGYGQDG